MKHFLSWILALTLLLGLVPMGVSAVEETGLICDHNRNGKLDYTDALVILQTFIGLSTAP